LNLIFQFIAIFLLISFTLVKSFSQTFISGKLVDEKNTPVPFAHIKIINSQKGTISNQNGMFKIVIPELSSNKVFIAISAIGFETLNIALLKNKHHTVTLKESVTLLQSVTVGPIDHAKVLIENARKAIPKNYPLVAERHTGFFRESMFREQDSNPVYVVEAVIEAIKENYQKSHSTGHVKLIESRKYESSQLDSVSIRIYAGAHHIHRFDMVAQRTEFLRNINAFNYEILDTVKYDGKDVFKVHFERKNKLSGNVFIMDSSFAIVKAEFDYSDITTFMPNIVGRSREYLGYTVAYKQSDDGLWRFNSSFYNTAFKLKGQLLKLTSLYTTTDVAPNKTAIEYLDRLQFGDILLENPKKYDPDFWGNYTVILPDEKIENIFEKVSNPSSKKKLLKIVSKLKLGYAISWSAINIQPYAATYSNPSISIDSNKNCSGSSLWGLSYFFLFEFKPHTYLGITTESSFTKTGLNSQNIAFSKDFNLNPKGRPIVVSSGLRIGYRQLNHFLGSYETASTYKVLGKTFDSNKTDIFLTQQNFHLQPNLIFSIEKSNRLSFFTSINYSIPFNNSIGLTFKERSGFFLFRKEQFLKNGHEGLSIQHNRHHIVNMNLSIEMGILLRFPVR